MKCGTKGCPAGYTCVKSGETGHCRPSSEVASIEDGGASGLADSGAGQADLGPNSDTSIVVGPGADSGAGGTGGTMDTTRATGVGGTGGQDGWPGAGGTTSAGGTTGLGGTPMSTGTAGGVAGAGGISSAGGTIGSGTGGSGTGGSTGTGGATGTGGRTGTGGSTGAGGTTVACTPQCQDKCSGPDSCGGTCPNTCVSPQTCGGGATANVCGCTPSCSNKCGGPDGCGATCADHCVAPQACAGNGTANVCETPPACTTASGSTWSQAAKSSPWPGGVTYCPMVYDSARDKIVMVNGSLWELSPSTNTWTNRTAATEPPVTSAHALAYDSYRGKVVLFGGYDASSNAVNTTWEWDGATGTWAPMTPSTLPPKTADCSMAFDPNRKRTVMLPGSNVTKRSTWEWDGSNWAERYSADKPGPAESTLVWDSVHARILAVSVPNPDTAVWAWNPSDLTWTRLSYGCTPSQRSGAAIAYDPGRDQIIYFGGNYNPGTPIYYGDLWAWAPDGSSWRQYQQPGSSPTAHYGASFVYDATRQHLLMFHGYNDVQGFLSDLWVLSFSP